MSITDSLQAELDELSHERDLLTAKLNNLPADEPEKDFRSLEDKVTGWSIFICVVTGFILLNAFDRYAAFIFFGLVYPGGFILGLLISALFMSVVKKILSRGYDIANGRIQNRRRLRKTIADQLHNNQQRAELLQYRISEIQFEKDVNDWMHAIRDGVVSSSNELIPLADLAGTFAKLKKHRFILHGKAYYESRLEAIANYLEGKTLVSRVPTRSTSAPLEKDSFSTSKQDVIQAEAKFASHAETVTTNKETPVKDEPNTTSSASQGSEVGTTIERKHAPPSNAYSAAPLQLPIQFEDEKEEDEVKVEQVSAIISPSPKRNGNLTDRMPKSKIDFKSVQETKWNIGELGEEFVLRYERKRLEKLMMFHSAANVKRVSLENDSLGYDIVSFNSSGNPFFIEVKTTTEGKHTPFFIGATEFERLKSLPDFSIYRVYDFDVTTERGSIFIINGMDELEKFFDAQPWQYVVFLK